MPLTTIFISSDKKTSSTYDNWLCTTDFGTHEDAQNAGIALTVPVYGIPLTASGNYSQSEKDSWKKTHCESTHATSSYAHAYEVLMKLVPPEAYRTWITCQMLNSKGFACALEQPSDENLSVLTLQTHWRPIPGDSGGEPVVSNSTIVGGLRDGKRTVFAPQTKLGAEPVAAIIRTPKNSDVAVVVNTYRGSCSGFASAAHPLRKAYCDKDPETGVAYTHEEVFTPQQHMTIVNGQMLQVGGDAANPGHEFHVEWEAPGPITSVSCRHAGTSEEITVCRASDDGMTAQIKGWINGQGGLTYMDVAYKKVCYLPVEEEKAK